ncbi:MAG TPA: SgcJ/EcaC family oxidoreductase [Gemmatimonadaceae bacterium]|nr:SgcJ/EcaC family oxidoreductase [Gemmatimonadaceae bacterium]
MDLDAIQDFAHRYTAAWCSQDPASVASFFTPDGVLVINGGTPHVGREAIAESARGFMTAFPDLIVEILGLDITREQVVYRWTLYGTNTGPGGTGRPVWIKGSETWRFGADGLVAHSTGQFDAAEFERQLQGIDDGA